MFLTSSQDCNSGMRKRIHFQTDMEHNICRLVNNSDVPLGFQFCNNITFILYIIFNVRYGTALTTILPILFLYLNTVTVTAGTFEP